MAADGLFTLKTSLGYYYATGRSGRYGRVNGDFGHAWLLCGDCARRIEPTLVLLTESDVEMIPFHTGGTCKRCGLVVSDFDDRTAEGGNHV